MIIQDGQSDGLLLPISHSCLALDVSRSGYYEWLKRSEMIPAENSESSDLIDQIQEIALEFPYYGYRRISAELQNRGYAVNHKRVLRIMRQEKLPPMIWPKLTVPVSRILLSGIWILL
jgi:hypothetical protein